MSICQFEWPGRLTLILECWDGEKLTSVNVELRDDLPWPPPMDDCIRSAYEVFRLLKMEFEKESRA